MHQSKHHVRVLSLMQLQNVGIDELTVITIFPLNNGVSWAESTRKLTLLQKLR